MNSCQQKETVSLQAWFEAISNKAGIEAYNSQQPYFPTITKEHPSFEVIQALVEWNVLDPSIAFDLDATLTNGWCAYTLMNLLDATSEMTIDISDITSHPFQKQIQASIENGYFEVDENNNFHPDKQILKKEAYEKLDTCIATINSRQLQPKTEIDWKQDSTPIEVHPIKMDFDNHEMQVDENTILDSGQYITWSDDSSTYYYEVIQQEGTSVFVKEIDLLDVTEKMDMQGSTKLDFSLATIVDGNEEIIQESTVGNQLTTVSTRQKQKTFQILDYNVVISHSGTNLKAEISKTFPYGSNLYASMKVNGVYCDYAFLTQEKSIKDAYFKVNVHAEEKIGVKNGIYKNLYGDFSKVDAKDFVTTLQNLYQEKQDVIEKTLTLCQIKVPIPNAPMLYVSMNLDLHFHMSGRVELTFTQDGSIGCEMKNGNLRFIKELKHNESNRIKASSQVSSGIRFGFDLVSICLMDVSINAGVNANLSTQFHVYDGETHTVQESDIALDVADTVGSDNPNILVCSNASTNLVLYVKCNSAKSQLGKWGFQKRLDLVSKSLLPKGYTHMENFQFVEKCTRKDREKKVDFESLKVTKKIRLENYSLVVKVNQSKQIQITGLPEGYTKDALVFSSSDESVASVDTKGNVTGLQVGNAIITIQSNDGSHTIQCNILVSGA